MFGFAARKKREANLIAFTIHGPEVGGVHLALAAAPGLNRCLVHRLDPRSANRVELSLVDRFEQHCTLLRELGQPRPTEFETGIEQALMLAVQRQVIGELVEQKAGHETYISAAAFDHAYRQLRTGQLAR